jgi:prophage regulatory protein
MTANMVFARNRRNGMAILRLPDVMRVMGYRAHASIYNSINDGIFTKPVAIGERSVGWPDDEVSRIYRARIAGFDKAQLKELVARLHADRVSGADFVMGGDAA